LSAPDPPVVPAPHTQLNESNADPNGTTPNLDIPGLGPRETLLSQSVAATAPSHRNAWKKDGKAWQLFFDRTGDRANYPVDMSLDDESTLDNAPTNVVLPQSLDGRSSDNGK